MKRLVIVLLMMIVWAGLVRAEDVKEVVVASAKELKGIKAKKITWKKDGAKMMLVKPHVLAQYGEKTTFDRLGNPITKKIKVSDASPALWMDATEVTVGQFKKFLSETDHQFDGELWGRDYRLKLNGNLLRVVDWVRKNFLGGIPLMKVLLEAMLITVVLVARISGVIL